MFSDYFLEKQDELQKALQDRLQAQGLTAPDKKRDVAVFGDFYTFLREHLPREYSIATGKVRNKKHLLNRNCDVLIYNKWCERYLDLTGGYVLADSMHAFLSLEAHLSPAALKTHANMSRALKSLYASERGLDDTEIIPVYSVLFAWQSTDSLISLASMLKEICAQKEIPLNQQTDMLVVLGNGIVIRDYEAGGSYRCIETGKDTLMWFYILFLEYIDREGRFQLDLRDYIKQNSEYKEDTVTA
ncbi:MAG: hypothetical protein KDK39_00810 [Leptospiraceae bacterium]|nr:hypothetical protein [Leptospiraceae bacterium]